MWLHQECAAINYSFCTLSMWAMHADITMNDGWRSLPALIYIFKICCLFTEQIRADMFTFIFSLLEL